MSRTLRNQGVWPASQYARYLWLAGGLWEDILALSELWKTISDSTARLVLARHALVDFDALDELLKEFHEHVKSEEISRLSHEDANRITEAFSAYHRQVEPKRQLLKEIRNNLGSHRTGLPWERARRGPTTSADEWGKWEQYLVQLEAKCNLPDWLATLNAASELVNALREFNMDAWFSWPEGQDMRFFMPILPPGHHPRREENSIHGHEDGAA